MDTVETKNSTVDISFKDDTKVMIKENSKLLIDDFVFNPNQQSGGKLGLKVGFGTVRYASGQIAHANPQAVDIQTPTATIAVRGTDFASTVDEFGKSLVILLPEPDGSTGEITVTNAAGSVILNKAFQATLISTMDSRPSTPVILNIDLQRIDNMLIVSPPNEIKTISEMQDKRANILSLTDLDIDFLKDNSLNDAFGSDTLGKDPLKDDYLADDPFSDCAKRDNVKLCGTIFGLDPSTKITSVVTGETLKIIKNDTYVVDLKFKKDSNEQLLINTSGKLSEININDSAGGSKIMINQSN